MKDRPTIGDVVEIGCNIEVRCSNPKCNHSSVIDAKQLLNRFAARLWLTELKDEVAPRMKCRACGRRYPYLERSTKPVNGPRVGPRDDQEYKMLCRQLRS